MARRAREATHLSRAFDVRDSIEDVERASRIARDVRARSSCVRTTVSKKALAEAMTPEDSTIHALEGAARANASIPSQEERALLFEANKELTEAVINGDVEGVKKACERGASVNYRSPTLSLGRTLLHAAARAGRVDVVRELLNFEANSDAKDDEGQTPLHYAAEGCHVEVLEELLQKFSNDADVKELNTALCSAVYKANDEDALANVIDKLKEHGADVNERSTKVHYKTFYYGTETALCIAAKRGMPNTIAKLVACGANVNGTTSAGYTAMHFAVLNETDEHGAVIDILVEKRAKVDVATPTGVSPLALASNLGSEVTILKLLEHGAAIDYAEGGCKRTALFSASTGAIDLLIEHNATIEFKDRDGQTAVHCAASDYDSDRIQALIRHGADVCVKDNVGNTPLHIAAQSGRMSNIQLLIANDNVVDKNDKNDNHETPLDVAKRDIIEQMKNLGFEGFHTGDSQLSIDLLDKRLRKPASPAAKTLIREWKFYELGEKQVDNSDETEIKELMEMQNKSIKEMIERQHNSATFGDAKNVNGADLSHISVLVGAWYSLIQSHISQYDKEEKENVRVNRPPNEETIDQQDTQNGTPMNESAELRRGDDRQREKNVVLAAHRMVVRYLREYCWENVKRAFTGVSEYSTEERSNRLHNVMTVRALNINGDELKIYTKGAGNATKSKPKAQFSLFPEPILDELLPAVNTSIELDTSAITNMSFEDKMSELMRCAEDEAGDEVEDEAEDEAEDQVMRDDAYEYFFQHFKFETCDDDDGTEKKVEKNWFKTEFYETHGFPAIFGEGRLVQGFYGDDEGVYWGLAHYERPDEERKRFSLLKDDHVDDEMLTVDKVDIDEFCGFLEEKLTQEHSACLSEIGEVHPCESVKDRQKLVSRKSMRNNIFGKCSRQVSYFHDEIKHKFGDKVYDLLRRAIRDLKPAEDMFGNIILKDAEGLGICGYALDHIFPWAKGGKTVADNLAAVHWGANLVKSDHLLQSDYFAGASTGDYEKSKVNHNLDWSKLRCGINMEEFIALCVYCTYDSTVSSATQARVNLEGNIANKYKDKIKQLSELLVRRGVQNRPTLGAHFQVVRNEHADVPKSWRDVEKEAISDRWSKIRELKALQREEDLKQDYILEQYCAHGQRIVALLTNLRDTSLARTTLLQSPFVGAEVEKWKQKVQIALEIDKKRDGDYKFYALSEEEEHDILKAFQEGVLASSTGGKMLALIWDLINTESKSGGMRF